MNYSLLFLIRQIVKNQFYILTLCLLLFVVAIGVNIEQSRLNIHQIDNEKDQILY
jgi:hypothetical protein